MKYIDFDSSGKITASYDDDIHGARLIEVDGQQVPNPDTLIPAQAVPIDAELWEQVIGSPKAYVVDLVTAEVKLRPPPSPQEIDQRLPALRDAAYRDVRARILFFVTDESASDFPDWKQANYNQAYAELLVAEMRGGMTQEQSAQLTKIRAAIAWKDAVLAERERVKAAIYAALSPSAIADAAASLDLVGPPFRL